MFVFGSGDSPALHSFPTRRSSDLLGSVLTADGVVELDASVMEGTGLTAGAVGAVSGVPNPVRLARALLEEGREVLARSEEHTSELQSLRHLVCRLLLEKKNRRYHSGAPLRTRCHDRCRADSQTQDARGTRCPPTSPRAARTQHKRHEPRKIQACNSRYS